MFTHFLPGKVRPKSVDLFSIMTNKKDKIFSGQEACASSRSKRPRLDKLDVRTFLSMTASYEAETNQLYQLPADDILDEVDCIWIRILHFPEHKHLLASQHNNA